MLEKAKVAFLSSYTFVGKALSESAEMFLQTNVRFLAELHLLELKFDQQNLLKFIYIGEQGWRSRISDTASYICGLSLLLVLILFPRVFCWVLWFSSLNTKKQHF